MDSKEHLASSASCDTLSTTVPETQWSLQLCMPTLKEETAECLNEYKYQSEHLDSQEYVNYYDSMGFEVKKLEKKFSEDEYPQSDFSINYTIVSENKDLLNLVDKQGLKHEKTEGGLSLIINEENVNKKNQFIVKMERLKEEQYILDNAGATSVHYDVLMYPQEVECKLCSRIFKNGFNLLRHNSEHIKVEINTPGDNNKVMELHQRQHGDRSFNNHDNMLAHVGDIHTKKILKGELGEKNFKSAPNLKRRVGLLHKQMSPNQVTGNSVKCKYCNVDYKHEDILYKHMEQCRTGKEVEEMKYKCDSCEGTYRSKYTLSTHVKSKHYDYGRKFDCWCGKQFRTPQYLRYHTKRQHDGKINDTNNDKLTGKEVEKMKYKCDSCEGTYGSKYSLTQHKKRMHYNYGRTFECWCGKRFTTLKNFRKHKSWQYDGNINDTNNDKLTGKEVE